MRTPACILIVALALLAPAAHADIYKYVDGDGVTHFSDRPLGPGYKLYMRGGTHPLSYKRPPDLAAYARNRRRFTPLINRVAKRVGIDSALVRAVVNAESAYDPNAVSSKGAIGLMQLMPGTAARYGVRDIHDPAQNVLGGVRYLRDLLLQFRDVKLALAAYNAGENAVIDSGHAIPPYAETVGYVRKVLSYYQDQHGSR